MSSAYHQNRAMVLKKIAAEKKRKRGLGLAGVLTALLALSAGAHVKRAGNARVANARVANARAAQQAATAIGLRDLNAYRAAAKASFVANLTKSYPKPVLVRNANNGRVNYRNVYNANGTKYIKRGSKVFTLKKEPHSGTLLGGLSVYTINSEVQF